MKYLAFLVVFLCESYTVTAQTCVPKDSITHSIQAINLDIPFIGIIELENPSYTFQNTTIPLQIPKIKKSNEPTSLELDSIVSVRLLDRRVEPTLAGIDSLDLEG